MNKVKVLAIPASTRQGTVQQEVMKKLNSINRFDLSVHIFDKVADLPLFTNTNADPAEPVVNFCQMVRAVDALVIYLPEFTFGVPGTLYNALRWGMPYDIFKDKSIALVTTARLKNTLTQGFINDISSQLYPVSKLRIYHLPHNLGLENETADIQCDKILQQMTDNLRQVAVRKKAPEFAEAY